MKNFQNTVLFCTVGGSHVPIVRAIESAQPRFVFFSARIAILQRTSLVRVRKLPAKEW